MVSLWAKAVATHFSVRAYRANPVGSAQGFTHTTPVLRNSLSFLVCTVKRRVTAVAAIIASGRWSSRGSPNRRFSSMMFAHASASARVQSNTRPSNVVRTKDGDQIVSPGHASS